MKLLLDQNLSDRIVSEIEDLYPGSVHVKALNMTSADDSVVWNHAKEEGFIILSKDWDFHQLSLLKGFPPKVIYLNMGNCTTAAIIDLMRSNVSEVRRFQDDAQESLLILGKV